MKTFGIYESGFYGLYASCDLTYSIKATTAILWPLYRSTSVRWHPQL